MAVTDGRRKFRCGKCEEEIEEWDRTPESDSHDFKCPNCNKPHIHHRTDAFEELIPVSEEDGEHQNVFITTTGRKIHGIDSVQRLLTEATSKKTCKNCHAEKHEDWEYSKSPNYDLACPECGKKHLEDTNKLIPVDKEGNRQDVMEDSRGRTYIGEEEIQEALEKLKEEIE